MIHACLIFTWNVQVMGLEFMSDEASWGSQPVTISVFHQKRAIM